MSLIRNLAARLVVACVMWLLVSVPSFAQGTFCAQQAYPGNTSQVCFSTLAQAEAHLRTESSPVAGFRFLELQSAKALGRSGQFIRYYDVPMMEPGPLYADYYEGYLTNTDGPWSGCPDRFAIYGVAAYGCDTEAQQVQHMLADYPYYNNFTGYVTGAYTTAPTSFNYTPVDPSTNIAYAWATFTSSVTQPHRGLVINGSSGPIFNPIIRHDFYPCPAGLYALNEMSNPKPRWPKVCYRYLGSSIIYTPKNISACHTEGDNPCVPATGAKLYTEQDFEFSGGALVRTYSSAGDVAVGNGFPTQKWTHSFYSQVSVSSDGDVYLITRRGHVEAFRKKDWNSDLYESKARAGVLLAKLSNGQWELREAGRIDKFDSSGLLIQGNVAGGASAHTLDYCTSPEYTAGSCNFPGLLDRVTYANGRSLTFNYSERTIEDTHGRVVNATTLDSVAASDGSLLVSYQFDTYGRLIKAINSIQQETTYVYGEAASVCRPPAGGPIACDPLNFRDHLTSVIEPDGLVRRYAYDANGKAVHTEVGLPETATALEYPTASTATATRSSGAKASYSFRTVAPYLPLSRVVLDTVTGKNQQTQWQYDANGLLTELSRPNGQKTKYFYTSATVIRIEEWSPTTKLRSRVTTNDAANGGVLEQAGYDALGVLVAKNNWGYNARGQVLTASATDPQTSTTRVTTTTYCEQPNIDAGTCPLLGLVTSIDGPRTDVNDVVTYTYYPSDDATCATAPTTCPHRKGDLWMVMDAVGNVTETLAYDGAGRVLSVKDANGIVTDFEYRPRGWLTARKVRGADPNSEADDRITSIQYYPTGLVQRTTLPDGSYTSFTYDPAHRLTDITDGAGNTIHYTLDNAGNRTKEDTQDSAGTLVRTLSRVYNQLGQLQTHKDAYDHGTGYAYDANGNTDTVTDALGRVADNDYDPLNRLTKTIQDVGGINATTQFKYDALDNLTEVVDPKNLSTKYTYNALGDLTQLESPDTGVTTYTYDSAGNRATQTDARGVTTGYGYDALNRLTSISYPDSSLNVGYGYDTVASACPTGETYAAGRLNWITDGSGSTQYCYDRFGQMVRKVQATAGQALTVRYAYTPAGQLSSVTYPDGTVADYVRDAQGRTTEVGVTRPGQSRQVLLTSASYHPFGPAAEWTFGNGRLFQRTLNQNYQPGVVQDQNPGGLSVGYEFDPVGNLAKLRNGNQNDPPLRLYSYDGLNRLTGAQDGTTQAFTEGYSYDATGNRTSATVDGATTAYTYPTDSHRLTDVGGTARSYDNVGNTTAIGAKGFVYNDANRMAQVTQAGASTASYGYNGKGEQVLRANGSTNTITVYDEAGHWLGKYDELGTPSQQVVWLDDLPVGLVAGTAAANQPLHYIEADALGTPRTVIEAQRDVAVWNWPLTGEAFGNDQPIADADGDGTNLVFNLRFPGQRYDAVSGLTYNRFRDYEAGAGRYLQSDPIGLHGGISTYGYAAQQPLTAIDPSGLKVIWSGTVATFAGIEGLGAGFFMFDLKSDCVGGKQVEAKVLASAVAAGIGAKWTGGASSVQLHDWTDQANADTLQGGFAAFSAGIVVGGGGGWSKYGLGNAWSDGFGLMPQGPAFGFDFSAGVYIGASYVLSSSTKDCSGCEQ